jgi:S-DNA-T family DNA segregation ATPase FtsK/SpoIIIE
LAASKRWAGRHFFLFVDDYDSLGTNSNTPLGPLVEYMPIGSDIGFHVIVPEAVFGEAHARGSTGRN